jgi:hypothetical protein
MLDIEILWFILTCYKCYYIHSAKSMMLHYVHLNGLANNV